MWLQYICVAVALLQLELSHCWSCNSKQVRLFCNLFVGSGCNEFNDNTASVTMFLNSFFFNNKRVKKSPSIHAIFLYIFPQPIEQYWYSISGRHPCSVLINLDGFVAVKFYVKYKILNLLLLSAVAFNLLVCTLFYRRNHQTN